MSHKHDFETPQPGTPLPWEEDEDGYIVGADGYRVASPTTGGSRDTFWNVEEANRTYILDAANMLPQLREQLETAQQRASYLEERAEAAEARAELALATGYTNAEADLYPQVEQMRAALEEIKLRPNQVCEDYELCTHPVCASSYAAFAIADKALREGAEK